MSQLRPVRRVLLAATLAASLTLPAIQTAQALTTSAAPTAALPAPSAPAPAPAAPAAPSPGAGATPSAFDEVDQLGTATASTASAAAAPCDGSLTLLGVPGLLPTAPGVPAAAAGPGAAAPSGASATTAAGVPCTPAGIAALGTQQLVDFLSDPAVNADCVNNLMRTWDARYAKIMDAAHIQAVTDAVVARSATDDGTGAAHLLELWSFLHGVVYLAWNNSAISVDTPDTQAALQRAVTVYTGSRLAFAPTTYAGSTLSEAMVVGGITGLRSNQLGLIQRILGTMGPGTTLAGDNGWSAAVLAALSANYLGIYNGDPVFENAIAASPAYRAAFRAYAGYTHLKGTANVWTTRDAMAEYGRFGQIPALAASVKADLPGLFATVGTNFGAYSDPWVKIVGWLNTYGLCQQFNVCTAQIEATLFPYTYRYDNGAIEVHTALDKATVDQMYYASKQVKTQFFRVLGTDVPLAGDVNSTLHIHLYASRSDYEVYHPLLTGMATNNGGIYIENGATFYTYQRRVPQDSTLTLEELFRHEYTHYLNGRWAVPGYFGNTRWYSNDMTTAMDEGTAEFFDGSTRDQGIEVRRSLVAKLAQDEASGIPRMTVKDLIHATYTDTPAFHFYNYAGTFFEFLWQRHPQLIRDMYGYQRADDPAGFQGWRDRVSNDAALNSEYSAWLDVQIAHVADLYVPSTDFTANGALQFAYPAEVAAAITRATSSTPTCVDNGDWANKPMRFVCTGRITANLSNAGDPNQVFKDMSHTVDYFILGRTKDVANNLNDMNCYFGAVDVWSTGQAGTATYTCEGPLRR
ncbi:collagenase [Kitasatospora nipponensis]|uniref:microbial collagenase n=1 Tax=Kitasatospora nipponensis TaxID=258049 RepID=A0ABP4GED9_9ACTN